MRAQRDPTADEDQLCRVLLQLRETPEIFTAIAAGPSDELALQRELRSRFSGDLVRAAIRIDDLRRRAAGRFTRAGQMWFDRVGLEQATSEPIARHKASRFSGPVDDLCCGIGGDTLALAAACEVRSIDMRASLTLMARWNAEVYEVADRVAASTGNVEDHLASPRLVHIDPDRRTGRHRSTRLEDYSPDLATLQKLMEVRPGGAIKVSPASNFGGKFPECEIELISLHGECKEAAIWFGDLAGPRSLRATLLPAGATIAGDPLEDQAPVRPLDAYIYDPDPAVVRAGLLDAVACASDLARLDDAEEYLTGSLEDPSEFVTAFRVLDSLPHNDKQVRRYFREADFGQVEIKCRHLSIDADRYRRKLALDGSEGVTLIFARIDGRSRAVVCQRVRAGNL